MFKKRSKQIGTGGAIISPAAKKLVMRVLDSLILRYFEAYTNVPMLEIDHIKEDLEHGKNPMDAKLILAEVIVARYHGANAARREKKAFINVFSKGDVPDTMPEIALAEGTWIIIDLLIAARLAASKSEARRLLIQGAVEINGVSVREQKETMIEKGTIIRVGKRKFVRVR